MVPLPPLTDAMHRMQALAALDLILSPEWQYRYYSFNAQWSPGQRMASMRNGCGDEWWMVQHESGWGALKGLNHESEAWDQGRIQISEALQALVPATHGDFAIEPAFCWPTTSFAYIYHPATLSWTRANDDTEFADLDAGEHGLLSLLMSPPEAYVAFAAAYYELEIPPDLVAHLYAHRPVTQEIVTALNPAVALADIATEFFDEIAYPR